MLTLDRLNTQAQGISPAAGLKLAIASGGYLSVDGAEIDLTTSPPSIILQVNFAGEVLAATSGRSRSASEIPAGDLSLPATDRSTGVPAGMIPSESESQGEEEEFEVETSDVEDGVEEEEEPPRETDEVNEPEPEPGTEQGTGAGTDLDLPEESATRDEFADLDDPK